MWFCSRPPPRISSRPLNPVGMRLAGSIFAFSSNFLGETEKLLVPYHDSTPAGARNLFPWGHVFGRVKKNVEPFPGSDSAQTRPPCLSTIFLQMARPMPVPTYSLFECNRWKI